jgi:hypothetical protein
VATLSTFKPPTPRVERAVPFHVGETLTYDVSWSAYLTAGTVVASVKEKKPSYNSTAYYIVVEGRPTPLVGALYSLYYKLDALLDAYTLLSQRGATYSEEGKRRRYRATRFDRVTRRAFFEDPATGIISDFAVSPTAQDALSAIYALRTVALKPAAQLAMAVSDNGTSYGVQMHVGGAEHLKTRVGEFNAWQVQALVLDSRGQALGRNIAIWISDDGRRLPVKLQAELPIGSFSLVLREMQGS